MPHSYIGALKFTTCHYMFLCVARMRIVSVGLRARRAAEPVEPEEEEPHHHAPPPPPPHLSPHHNYDHMKSKFMNELGHLPSEYAPPSLVYILYVLQISILT